MSVPPVPPQLPPQSPCDVAGLSGLEGHSGPADPTGFSGPAGSVGSPGHARLQARAAAIEAAVQAARSIVFACHGPSCTERGSPELVRRLRERLNESSARRAVRVCETSCLDHCATGPNVLIAREGGIQAGMCVAKLEALLAMLEGGIAPERRPQE
jgi:(2Fe-2S) ferredoxin